MDRARGHSFGPNQARPNRLTQTLQQGHPNGKDQASSPHARSPLHRRIGSLGRLVKNPNVNQGSAPSGIRPPNTTPKAKTTSVARSTGPDREVDKRFSWSACVWGPPPESNRRPHPYPGTTRNRCADRRFPRSCRTVGAEVIGSLSRSYALTSNQVVIIAGEATIVIRSGRDDRPPGRESYQPVEVRPGACYAEVLSGGGSSGVAGW
jgi:hypothetical protein